MYVTDPQTGLRSTEVSHENENVFLVFSKELCACRLEIGDKCFVFYFF